MAVPTESDFNKWDGTKFTNTDWDQNIDKTVEILANGNYDLNVAQVTATSYVGIPSDQFSTITAGENLTAGDVVRISGGQAYKADNSTSAGITAVVGVCNTTVSSGGTVKIDYGFYNGFSSLTVGTLYYLGTSGAITATKPSTYIVELGVAVSTTRINLDISVKIAGQVIDSFMLSEGTISNTFYQFQYLGKPYWGQALFSNGYQARFRGKFSAGSAASNSNTRVRFINAAGTTLLYENRYFNYTRANRFHVLDFDIKQANTTALDLSSTHLPGVTTGYVDDNSAWYLSISGSAGSPTLEWAELYLYKL